MKYKCQFNDSVTEIEVDADYYKKEYNPNSRTFEYIFYFVTSGEEHAVFLIPTLWLVGDPVEVKES